MGSCTIKNWARNFPQVARIKCRAKRINVNRRHSPPTNHPLTLAAYTREGWRVDGVSGVGTWFADAVRCESSTRRATLSRVSYALFPHEVFPTPSSCFLRTVASGAGRLEFEATRGLWVLTVLLRFSVSSRY